MTDRRLLTRVVLHDYKSIARCDVRPAQLSYLVGPNGSGKSNFLDALSFVADALRFSLDHAVRTRGGMSEVRRRSSARRRASPARLQAPRTFGIRLEFRLAHAEGWYAFVLQESSSLPFSRGVRLDGFTVQRESCMIIRTDGADIHHYYRVEDGEVQHSTFPPPASTDDRLYLVNVSGLPEFRPLYDALSGMGFYNLSPAKIRDLQPPDSGNLLSEDGSNLASVLSALEARSPEVGGRILEYLSKIVPGLKGVTTTNLGPRNTLEFRQEIAGAKDPLKFLANSMSDGTLRALAILVALFQAKSSDSDSRPLVGIEEPEIALHPAAAGVLTDALREASEHVQVLVTSHSPDLLDDDSIPDDSILAVISEKGETQLGPLDEAGRSVMRDHLYTAGELLRMDQLQPDPALANPKQSDLFEGDS